MVNIQSPTAEIRRGKKKKKEERTNHSMKIYMVSLFHRATINKRKLRKKCYEDKVVGSYENVKYTRPWPRIYTLNSEITIKDWDSAYLRQGTSYQCCDTDPDPYPYPDP